MKNIYVSKKLHKLPMEYLLQLNYKIHLVKSNAITYNEISTHADIFYCRMGANKNADIFVGDTSEIGFKYPENICFNAVCLDKYFIHNLKYTSPTLLREAKNRGLNLINVKQGYTKCNIVAVDGNSVVTSDDGIFKTLSNYSDINVLKIQQGFVKLEGFEYGFLGGASGRVGNEIVFNGNLSNHPDFAAICKFIQSRGLNLKYFPEYELEDIGSIIAE